MANVKVGSTITLNTAKLAALDRERFIALSEAADATLTELRDRGVMPFDTGNMQNDSTFVDDTQRGNGRVSITTTAPQARRLYFHPEYNFRRNNNAGAGGRWFDSFLTDNFIRNAYTAIFGRNFK